MKLSAPFRHCHRWRATALAAGLTALAVVAVTTGTTVAPANAATAFSDDFESGSLSGWSKSGGDWSIVTDGSKVLRQANAGSGNARQFAGPGTGWSDYTVQARVKPLSLGGNATVGLLARAASATKFYRLALLPGNKVQLQAVNGSSYTVLGTASRTVTAGTWYTLSITTSGSTVSASVDGTPFATATGSLATTGRIGLQTLSSSAAFDDVLVTTGGPSPSPTPTPTLSPTPNPPGDTLYVAPNGTDSAAGTESAPTTL
ncbi:family 16 glycoside hydrolase, partial [Streptosporangium sp. LJ11]|uniref:family 16 glycoside hydrolase n=1 Tax=Streptosporangium sp. LJ11 TaxID=3436927 RepID=UPI003F78C30D